MANVISVVRIPPGSSTQLPFDLGDNLGDILEEASIATDGFDIQLNGDGYDPDMQARNGDVVILTKSVKGA